MRTLTFREKYEIYTLARKKAKVYGNVISFALIYPATLLPLWFIDMALWLFIVTFIATVYIVSIFIIAPIDRCIFKLTYKSIKRSCIK